ncbi:MAG: hypothetical protein KBD06_05065 [Candidatus Pacebacteria bacterium]|nr:hypothetical protein [Candidatus Paceibacterota bacterium]
MTPETNQYWWKQAKIYELYIDKFADNIQGLTANLDYFVALGINTLHILPHYPSPMVDDGYDISDYRAVRPELGTLQDFQILMSEARFRNIRIIVDLVLNHTSDMHPWFIEARSSKHNPKRNYYLWSDTGAEFSEIEPAMPEVNDKIWTYNPDTDDYYFTKFYAAQPDLNWDNPDVFREMMDVMYYWADLGVSGFRLDAAPYLIKRAGSHSKGLPETHAIIKKVRAALEQKYPNVILLAEAHQSIADTKKYFGDGDECHMVYHFSLMEQMWLALKSGDRDAVQAVIDESYEIPDACQWAIFLRNHDEVSLSTLQPGIRSALVEFLDPQGLFHFRKGETASVRIGSVFRGDRVGMRKAFTLLYSLPGSPIMYYGDELGMSNLPHEESVIDSRKYVRGRFDWRLAEEQFNDPSSLFHEVALLIHGVPTEESETPPTTAHQLRGSVSSNEIHT